MTGKVWLVGAGPGDVGLLTLRGREVLENADVVVYDALVGQGILPLIPERARLIFAGKRAGNHYLRQEETNRVLLDEALKGNNVVRLKGGDPFLFGRGGAHGVDHDLVFFPIEQMGGLDQQVLHPIGGHALQRAGDGIDFQSLFTQDLFADHAAGPGAVKSAVGERGGEGVLERGDRALAGRGDRGAEADD